MSTEEIATGGAPIARRGANLRGGRGRTQRVEVPIPKRLVRVFPPVEQTAEALANGATDNFGRVASEPEVGVASVRVSQRQVRFALRVLQGLARAAELRGHLLGSFDPDESADTYETNRPGVGIDVHGFTYEVTITEQLIKWSRATVEQRSEANAEDTIGFASSDDPSIPSGELLLHLPWHSASRSKRTRWLLRASTADNRSLSNLFPSLEVRAAIDDPRRKEELARRLERAETAAAKASAQKAQKRAEHEREFVEFTRQARAFRAREQAGRWKQGREMRGYAAELSALANEQGGEESKRLHARSKWIEDHAGGIDPLADLRSIRAIDDAADREAFERLHASSEPWLASLLYAVGYRSS